jgi:hypothetical protein
MTAIKTKPTRISVTAYIDSLPDPVQRKEARQLTALYRKVTGKPATMWGPSIIGFGRYHYRYDSGHEGDMPRAAFSPRKGSHVLYVLNGAPGEVALLKKLGNFKTGRVCLYLKGLAGIDMGVLERLIAASLRENTRAWPDATAR